MTASFTEDTYGQVQRVIPATLEAWTKYHTALATFELDFRAQADARGPVWHEAASKLWVAEVEPVRKSEWLMFHSDLRPLITLACCSNRAEHPLGRTDFRGQHAGVRVPGVCCTGPEGCNDHWHGMMQTTMQAMS